MVKVGRGDGPGADRQRGQRTIRGGPEAAMAVIQEEPRLVLLRARGQGIAPLGDEEVLPSGARRVKQEHRPVVDRGAGRHRRRIGREVLLRGRMQDAQGVMRRAAQNDVVASVAEHVAHRQAGPVRVLAERDEPLAHELVDGLLVRHERQARGARHLLKLPGRAWRVAGTGWASTAP